MECVRDGKYCFTAKCMELKQAGDLEGATAIINFIGVYRLS
jgi:hypothetical protein